MWVTARPKSAMTALPSPLTSTFLLLMSLCAMAGLPWVPWISVCRCTRPVTVLINSRIVSVLVRATLGVGWSPKVSYGHQTLVQRYLMVTRGWHGKVSMLSMVWLAWSDLAGMLAHLLRWS